jgi:hypothetical protein
VCSSDLVWTGAENLARTGIRSPNRPSRSESLYRLRHSGPSHEGMKQKYYYFSFQLHLHPVLYYCGRNQGRTSTNISVRPVVEGDFSFLCVTKVYRGHSMALQYDGSATTVRQIRHEMALSRWRRCSRAIRVTAV